VTGRVLAVLGAFDEHHRSLSLTSIARRAGLPLSTAHRMVAELVSLGALAPDPGASGGRDYVIGRRIWDIGLLAPVQTTLREAASPFLHDLYAATLATVHLAVRDGDEVLYVERLRGRASVEIVSTVGSSLPLYSTGVGKVLLAHAPAAVVDRVLGRLEPVTAHTITDPAVLRAELARVRRDDVATTNQEMSLGGASIAVPVRRHGEVVAAIGVVVPTLQRDRGRMVTALQVAARGIGRQL
jgi:DNA-binding IclR family transcriptional regulator